MQYALINNVRTGPLKGLKGACEGCNNVLVAKCGNVKLHHWAHKSIRNCDSWWEPETQWHRDWKNKFPPEFREVVLRDEVNNEIHRADIRTSNGVTIEFQNSPISLEERYSRDNFYRKIIWVVNAAKFNIQTSCYIPDPQSPLLKNYVFRVDEHGFARHMLFTRKKDLLADPIGSHQVFGLEHAELKEVARKFDRNDDKYRMITWKNKHTAWLETIKPVFLDYGHDNLYWLRLRHQFPTALRYIQLVKKTDFLKKYAKLWVMLKSR